MAAKNKTNYFSSAALLLTTSVLVKVLGAVYKIPLTAFIGAVGRGYFATAYNLYMPLHVILMGSLPIALSRLVSRHNAVGDVTALSSLRKGALSVFTAVGAVGTGIILLAAMPYTRWIAGSPKSIYTVLVLAPSLLFACVAACQRSYFEGLLNMRPTAVSQILEAVCKLLFGLALAKWSLAYLLHQFSATGMILDRPFNTESEALSFIYPITSAAAMLGVTFGTLVSMVYTGVYTTLYRDRSLPRVSAGEGKRELLHFSFPIMVSCAVQSVFQFLDTATVQLALSRTNIAALKALYADSLQLATVPDGDLVTYIYGLFSASLDFKNLIPGITMALGVCAVPAVCREYESDNREHLTSLMNTVYRATALLSVGGGVLLALTAEPILRLFYGSAAPDLVAGCAEPVKYFALTVPVYAMASTAVFFVQALGKPERSIVPYIVSGLVRMVLNMVLVPRGELILNGAVIAGAIGYAVLAVMNMVIAGRLSGVRADLQSVLWKPLIIGAVAFFVCRFLFSTMTDRFGDVVNLLIEAAVFSVIFCILCLLLREVKLQEIISAFQRKKMA
ncbi:MAG: polysaccharide biosynthesis C-terminal domain-containing protein [Eubacterium sp.]|nr:polysaccharide biosynthesis C-terminal domain-containing protein [Eubacterium sp.]